MHCSHRVLKAGMQRPGIDQIGQAELLDVPEPLKIRVLNKVGKESGIKGNESVQRIVDDFLFTQNSVDYMN